MSKEENDRLERMEKTLARIETAVLGDEKAGHLGLVSRMNNHAARLKNLERWKLYYVGVAVGFAAAIGGLYRLALDWLRR